MLFDGKTKHKYLEMNYAYSWNDEAYYGCGGGGTIIIGNFTQWVVV